MIDEDGQGPCDESSDQRSRVAGRAKADDGDRRLWARRSWWARRILARTSTSISTAGPSPTTPPATPTRSGSFENRGEGRQPEPRPGHREHPLPGCRSVFSFDVQVQRIYGAGNYSTSGGDTTVLLVKTTSTPPRPAAVLQVYNKYSASFTPAAFADSQSLNHVINTDPYDLAFVDPTLGSTNDPSQVLASIGTERDPPPFRANISTSGVRLRTRRATRSVWTIKVHRWQHRPNPARTGSRDRQRRDVLRLAEPALPTRA